MITLLHILFGAQRQKMDERGASAVEYGLLIAGVAALIVAAVFTFGGTISDIFDETCADVNQAAC